MMFLIGGVALLVAYVSMSSEQVQQQTKEQQLAQILMQMDGVGKAVVFLYQNNFSTNNNFLDNWMQIDTPSQQIVGVLVVCEGAKNVAVQQQLKSTLSTLLNLPVHKIVINEMQREE